MTPRDAPRARAREVAPSESLSRERIELVRSRWPVARHEAAHAVVGWAASDTEIVLASVVSDGATAGRVWRANPRKGDPATRRARLLKATLAVLAGVESDQANGERDWRRSWQDIRLAESFLADAAPTRQEANALRETVQAAARLAVFDCRHAIDELAAYQCIGTGELSGAWIEWWLAQHHGGLRMLWGRFGEGGAAS